MTSPHTYLLILAWCGRVCIQPCRWQTELWDGTLGCMLTLATTL